MKAIAARQTTTIRASMTAYSTAVGPSSARRKRSTVMNHLLIDLPLSDPRPRPKGWPCRPLRRLGSEGGKNLCPRGSGREGWVVWSGAGQEVRHPFGSLAASGVRGPWLCAPASRRVCHFEDEEATLCKATAGWRGG